MPDFEDVSIWNGLEGYAYAYLDIPSSFTRPPLGPHHLEKSRNCGSLNQQHCGMRIIGRQITIDNKNILQMRIVNESPPVNESEDMKKVWPLIHFNDHDLPLSLFVLSLKEACYETIFAIE
jgi:hypothetical protein